MRVLILGNSHVAAPKSAWAAERGRWPALQPRFVGGHGEVLGALRAEAGWLLPQTADAAEGLVRLNGDNRFALGDYDAFAVIGCGIGLHRAVLMYRGARLSDFPSVAGGMDPPVPLVSRAFFRAALAEQLAATTGARLAAEILAGLAAQGRQAPVLLSEQPRPSTEAGKADGQVAGFLRARRLGDAVALAELHEAAAAAAVPGARFLPQPAETRADALFTRPAFSAGSLRLTRGGPVAHPADDHIHGNAAYGAALLDAIVAALAPPPPLEAQAPLV